MEGEGNGDTLSEVGGPVSRLDPSNQSVSKRSLVCLSVLRQRSIIMVVDAISIAHDGDALHHDVHKQCLETDESLHMDLDSYDISSL